MKYVTSKNNGRRDALSKQYLQFGTLKLNINAEGQREQKTVFLSIKKGQNNVWGSNNFFWHQLTWIHL